MPKAGFSRRTPLRIEETGYATGPGRSERDQATATAAFARAAHRYRGTYAISDFRFFGLRDNNSHGPDGPAVLRAAARRLLGEAGVRRLPPGGRPLRRPRALSATSDDRRAHDDATGQRGARP